MSAGVRFTFSVRGDQLLSLFEAACVFSFTDVGTPLFLTWNPSLLFFHPLLWVGSCGACRFGFGPPPQRVYIAVLDFSAFSFFLVG